MKWKQEISNKFDFLKEHSVNFILNEKKYSEIVHEKNARKISDDFYSLGGVKNVKEQGNIIQEKLMEPLDYGNLYKLNAETAKTGIVTETKIDYTGSVPKRYTTRCYIQPKVVPTWYTESVILHIGSTRRRHTEKVYFENKILPVQWTENMVTEVISRHNETMSGTQVTMTDSERGHTSIKPLPEAVSN